LQNTVEIALRDQTHASLANSILKLITALFNGKPMQDSLFLSGAPKFTVPQIGWTSMLSANKVKVKYLP
jgi:hypothetical protein